MPKRGAPLVPFLCFAIFGLMTVSANAGIITFSGLDPGAGASDPRPNSNVAAASFDASNPGLSIITFESAPVGAFTNLTVAPGVVVNGSDIGGDPQTIINTPICDGAACGFNTTAGGSQWLSLYAGSVTFTFASPIHAFGAYLSGLQEDGSSVTFNDGAPQSVGIPNPGGTVGGVGFVGFSDTSAFSSVTININLDVVGVDDVRTGTAGTAGAVPEPATFGLLGAALAGLALVRRRLS